jgi:hypothetical protein
MVQQSLSLPPGRARCDRPTCIDVEEVIPCHAKLTGYACRDDDEVAAVECCRELGGAGVC